ncbi:type II secretion system protein [Candidatus Gracilibacteria bacterium]|nr:type II secretion system protein [Candidatus Gracilibacteria bacterium]
MKTFKTSGFTIIELILTVAAMAILVGFSFGMYRALQGGNDLENIQNIFVQTSRRAQLLAQASDGDSAWGVSLQNGFLVLFQGDSFATRNPDRDETFEISPSITFPGITEVVFEKFSGRPNTSGSIILNAKNGDSRTLLLNAYGMIEY